MLCKCYFSILGLPEGKRVSKRTAEVLGQKAKDSIINLKLENEEKLLEDITEATNLVSSLSSYTPLEH